MDPDQYCRDVESHLCRKNNGHLIRIVGPSFELVCGWAARGIPLKVALHGIDRYFERYYSKGPRRHPVRIAFCEPDVLDVFDEWRRAVGISLAESSARRPASTHSASSGLRAVALRPGTPQPLAEAAGSIVSGVEPSTGPGQGSMVDGTNDSSAPVKPRRSLVAHVDRIVGRLAARQTDPATAPQGGSRLGDLATAALDSQVLRAIERLESIRDAASTSRGQARARLIDDLAELDRTLGAAARESCPADVRTALAHDAAADLEPFRERMPAAAYQQALDSCIDRLLRERLGLPRIAYE